MLPRYHSPSLMPARPKIPSDVILRAIKEWRGNVSAAAQALGIHPKNLRERLARMGVDLEAVRSERSGTYGTYQTSSDVSNRSTRVDTFGTVRNQNVGTYGPKSGTDTLAKTVGGPNVSVVQQATATKDEIEDGLPVRPSRAPAKQVRIKPDFQQQLRDLKIEFISRFKRDFDEQDLCDQFFAEALAAWGRSKLDPAPPRPRRTKDVEKGGDPK